MLPEFLILIHYAPLHPYLAFWLSLIILCSLSSSLQLYDFAFFGGEGLTPRFLVWLRFWKSFKIRLSECSLCHQTILTVTLLIWEPVSQEGVGVLVGVPIAQGPHCRAPPSQTLPQRLLLFLNFVLCHMVLPHSSWIWTSHFIKLYIWSLWTRWRNGGRDYILFISRSIMAHGT